MMDFLQDVAIFTAGILSIVFWAVVIAIAFIEVIDFLLVDPINKKRNPDPETSKED